MISLLATGALRSLQQGRQQIYISSIASEPPILIRQSHKNKNRPAGAILVLVDRTGFEPVISSLPGRRVTTSLTAHSQIYYKTHYQSTEKPMTCPTEVSNRSTNCKVRQSL
nr:hypothetical protein [uncultured bacterium]